MIQRRRFLSRLPSLLLGLALLGVVILPGRPANADAAGTFLQSLTAQAIEQLTDASVPQAEREARFRELFRRNFDLPRIGRFVLGRYWRGTDEKTRQDFMDVFEDLLVQRFAPQFAGYADTRFLVGGVRQLKAGNQVMVTSTVEATQGEPVKVDWRIREESDGMFKILDVVGEGVSMALTLRSEYASAIKQAGGRVETLVEKLRERTRRASAQG